MLLISCVLGCGGGLTRYDISGEVTHAGKPVPAGTISFEPKDQQVMGGFAAIVNGKYDTSQKGVGHIGGEHVIKITGDARPPVNPNSFEADSYVGKPLFPKYETTADLPFEQLTKDFDVPAR